MTKSLRRATGSVVFVVGLILIGLVLKMGSVAAQDAPSLPAPAVDVPAGEATSAVAVLAGGCFWGIQDLVRSLPGVESTRVGYTGGQNEHPTYRNHPGHAEAIEITYDPTKTDYRALLEFFFQIHDPTTKNRQGNDVGTSYRSAIFYLDD